MKKLLILSILVFVIICVPVYAGVVVCHENGEIVKMSSSSTQIQGCEFYTITDDASRTEFNRVKNLVKNNQRRRLKWTTKLETKTQAELDIAETNEGNKRIQRARLEAKDRLNSDDPDQRLIKAALIVLHQRVNQNAKAQDRMTAEDFYNAIRNRIDND